MPQIKIRAFVKLEWKSIITLFCYNVSNTLLYFRKELYPEERKLAQAILHLVFQSSNGKLRIVWQYVTFHFKESKQNIKQSRCLIHDGYYLDRCGFIADTSFDQILLV